MTDSKRAVIWAAVSSKRQAEDDKISLEYQEARGREWCTANGYSVVEVLCVPGHSRSDPNIIRMLKAYEDKGIHAYARLQELWEARGFDVLVAYSSDRLGRSGALIHWVIETTIHEDSRLFLTDDGGWVDRDNYRMRALFGTAAATLPMDSFKDKTLASKEKLAAQGLSVGRWPFSHVPVRDSVSGKTIGVVVNEDMRPFFTAIAQLLIDRTPWHDIGPILYARGFATRKGDIYSASSIRQFILNGWVFGHTVRGITKNGDRRNLRGAWLFDDDAPLPSGVQVFRNVVPPLFEGEFMEQLKAELRRRPELTGRAGPNTAHRFSRLCICADCGALMSARVRSQKQKGKHTGYKCCRSFLSIAEDKRCANRFKIGNETIQAFVDKQLSRYLGIDTGALLPDVLPQVSEADRLADELERLNAQLSRAIDEQLLAPEALQPRYRQAAKALSEKIVALEAQQRAALKDAALTQRAQQERQNAGDFIRETGGLEKFWQLPDAEINQWLLRFFGDRRLAVKDRQIVALKRYKRRNAL